MARTITWLGAVGLALGLVLGNRAAMAQETQAQPAADPAVWGIYAQLAGSTRQASDGYRLHWRWSQPGKELVEEYIAPSSGKLMHTSTITPGPGPGMLHVSGSSLGGKEWNGTLQPDGSVVFAGTGMLKMSYKATLASDGAYEIRMVKLRNGVVESTRELTSNSRYLLVEAAATAVATPAASQAVAPVATAATASNSVATATALPAQPAVAAAVSPAAPAASVADTAAQAVAVAPQEPAPAAAPPIDPEQLRQRNRNLRDYYERTINGPNGTPGVWLELTGSGSGISRSRRTEDGAEITFSFVRENGEFVVDQTIQHFDGELGRVVRYIDGEPAVAAEIVRLPGGAFRVQTLPGFGVSAEDAAGNFQDVAFIEDRRESTTSKGTKRVYRWAPESEATSAQAAIQKRQAWLEAERVAAARKAEEERLRQAAAAAALAEQIRQQEAAEQERLAYEAEADAEFEAERLQRAALWQQAKAASEQGLADSISRLNNTVASVEAQQAQYRAQQEAASRAADAQRAREATERQNEIARQYEAQRQAQQQAQQQAQAAALVVAANPSPTPSAAAPAAAGGGQWFVFCVAIKPGAYMDAPGAMFLSAISAVARQGYSSQASGESFGSRVSAQYGVSVGAASCNSYPDQATAQARWQEQHDTFGLKFYKKVVTGMPATP